MTARKKNGKKSAGPFSQLKGFRVSKPEQTKVQKKKESSSPPTSSPAVGDDELFLEEMTRMGILTPEEEPLSGDGAEGFEAGAEEGDGGPEPTERELFLRQVGGFDVLFEDEYPEDEGEAGSAVPRRMKQLRQGRLKPEATLDLHGLDRREARERLRYFLEDMTWQGRKTVLIITGRGLGSGERGPILRSEAENFLSGEGKSRVLEWGRAPRRYGGEGALVVFLRSRKETPK